MSEPHIGEIKQPPQIAADWRPPKWRIRKAAKIGTYIGLGTAAVAFLTNGTHFIYYLSAPEFGIWGWMPALGELVGFICGPVLFTVPIAMARNLFVKLTGGFGDPDPTQ
jgi:hypothetical protein